MQNSKLIWVATCAFVFAACGDDEDDNPDASVQRDATGGNDARADGGGNADADEDVDGSEDGGVSGESFAATLTGAEENPPVDSPYEGTAQFSVSSSGVVTLTVSHNIPAVTAGHVHSGIGGENGPPIFAFTDLDMEIEETFTPTAEELADLRSGHLYVNLHTTEHPMGELRGQILRPGERLFVAKLHRFEEVPVTTSTATGVAALILNEAGDSVHFDLRHNADAAAAHIHLAPAGTNGGVVFPIDGGEGDAPVSAEKIADLEGGRWYANVHTADFPNGAIRGQVTTPGAHLFVATLSGAQEVPPVAATSTGSAMVIVEHDRTSLIYHVTTTASVVASHIHRAPGGVSGPVLIPLEALPMNGVITGTAATSSAAVGEALRGLWYVNVHTPANPNGELRGQLIAPGEILFTTMMSGDEETPPNASNGSGGFGLILSADRSSARGNGSVEDLSGPITAAHIHRGAPGVAGPPVQAIIAGGMELSIDMELDMMSASELESGEWYVNVHTMMFPDGEIRGQLEER